MRELWNSLRSRSFVYSTTGIIFLAVAGLIFLIRPGAAISAVCRLAGIALLVYGILFLLRSLRRPSGSYRMAFLIFSLILILIGISIVSNPFSLVRLFGSLLAVFLLGYGIYSLVRLLRYKGSRSGRWWVGAAGAAVELVIGIMLLAAPVRTSAFVLRLIGILFLYMAASAIVYRKRTGSGGAAFDRRPEDPLFRTGDIFGRFTGRDVNGKEIFEGTARDVTDEDTHRYK